MTVLNTSGQVTTNTRNNLRNNGKKVNIGKITLLALVYRRAETLSGCSRNYNVPEREKIRFPSHLSNGNNYGTVVNALIFFMNSRTF